ncbi:helix-turn-helix transcriptional regulator [Streptomyces sp. NBC_01353]|uniref:helix-turn-helix transcriptional regulator n=1 Tax=Streptomyces sp. NBC_01353 TaxID=2903835 RepID=UPI002E3022F8|nr:helix-turn-helix transcriptional regulator [Streptomyces sp. NBC_01353]
MATAVESTDAKGHRLAELREFLMSRRARVRPAEAGLPDGGARRRTPGLRREEVAVLAGVGVSWYQWLEQGRDITVSPQVLDSVARVLRLSGAERRHLYVLAGLNPPAPEVDPEARDMCAGLRRLIDAWMPFPAHIMDAYWNTIMYNESAAVVLGMRPEISQNCLVSFFTDPIYRSRSTDWRRLAPQVVAQFRAACSECPDDEGFRAVVEEAKAASEEFAELWERQDISPGGQIRKEIEHPLVGVLHVESTQLRVPARPDLTIIMHTPLPQGDTAAKLEWLVSPEGRRGAMYPVAG